MTSSSVLPIVWAAPQSAPGTTPEEPPVGMQVITPEQLLYSIMASEMGAPTSTMPIGISVPLPNASLTRGAQA